MVRHDEAQRDGVFSLWRQVLVGEATKHPGEALVKVLHVGAVGFSGVGMDFQKVGLGDSAPRRCNRVRLESVGFGVVVTVKSRWLYT